MWCARVCGARCCVCIHVRVCDIKIVEQEPEDQHKSLYRLLKVLLLLLLLLIAFCCRPSCCFSRVCVHHQTSSQAWG